MISKLVKAIIICGTLYAPLELTRYIVAFGLTNQLIFEIIFIWVLYVISMSIVCLMHLKK